MTTQTDQVRWDGGGRFAPPVAGMEIVSDSTICLMPHLLTRQCPVCGTVFRASVLRPFTADGAASCPYCRNPDTAPLRHVAPDGRDASVMPRPPLAAGTGRGFQPFPAAREETA